MLILFIGQILAAFLLILLIFFSFLFYMIGFIEERVSLTVKFGWCLIFYNLFCGFLLLFTDFSIFTAITTLITNGFWIYMFFHGFPFISMTSFSLIGGIISTFISHFLWLYELIQFQMPGFFALSLYITLVWGIPILTATSLFTYDESSIHQSSSNNRASYPKSALHEFLEKKLQLIKSIIPHSGDKLD